MDDLGGKPTIFGNIHMEKINQSVFITLDWIHPIEDLFKFVTLLLSSPDPHLRYLDFDTVAELKGG